VKKSERPSQSFRFLRHEVWASGVNDNYFLQSRPTSTVDIDCRPIVFE